MIPLIRQSRVLERKKNYKVRDHCHYMGKYRGAAHNVCNLRYKVPKEIPVVFHNGSTYDYHFIIKELVIEFEGNSDCLGENTEKYITFSVPLKKKIQNKNIEITYKIKFIDSFRFWPSSLSKLVDNLSKGIHNNKCADCKSNLDYIKTTPKPSSLERKNEKLILECYNCKQCYRKKFNKELIKRFASTYEFCNNDLNKFVLLLRKGVCPYEYMDTWERFSEISLPSKEDFYSNLNMEDISDIDYRHANNVFKVFKLENLGDYHDLYVLSDTLLLADVFNNFRDMCIKEYELDPAHFLSLPGLAWQACLKKTNIELELLTDYDMLLMVEEGIRGGICHSKKPYIDMNTELRKLARNDFEKDLFKLMNNSVFGKAMENIRKHRDIKLVTTDKKRSKLVSEPNFHAMNLISENLSINEMKKTKIKMNKPIYLGLSILEISKILMHEFWCHTWIPIVL